MVWGDSMKFLLIFVDMLRPGLLSISSGVNSTETRLDNILKGIGGTIYTNCYTPSPDTPRSIATIWSGCYPSKNGCDKRVKWPAYFMNKDDHLLSILSENGYHLNLYTNPGERMAGLLPPGYDKFGYYNSELDIDSFLKDLVITEDSLTFISLSDFHWVLDDYGYFKRSVPRGYDVLADIFEKILSKIDIDLFDAVTIFSDHGFKLQSDMECNNKLELVNEDRLQTFLLFKEKGKNELTYSNRLTSTMDIYPTVLDVALLEKPLVHGVSLFEEKGHTEIVVEDFSVFKPQLNQTADLWAVITKDGVVCKASLNCHWVADGYTFEDCEKYILDYSAFYQVLKKENEVLSLYTDFVNKKTIYNNGQERDNKNNLLSKLVGKTLVFFGTGMFAESLLKEGITTPISYFVDNDPIKWGTMFHGKNILSPAILISEEKSKIIILVASSYYDEISEQLESYGFLEFKHFWSGTLLLT